MRVESNRPQRDIAPGGFTPKTPPRQQRLPNPSAFVFLILPRRVVGRRGRWHRAAMTEWVKNNKSQRFLLLLLLPSAALRFFSPMGRSPPAGRDEGLHQAQRLPASKPHRSPTIRSSTGPPQRAPSALSPPFHIPPTGAVVDPPLRIGHDQPRAFRVPLAARPPVPQTAQHPHRHGYRVPGAVVDPPPRIGHERLTQSLQATDLPQIASTPRPPPKGGCGGPAPAHANTPDPKASQPDTTAPCEPNEAAPPEVRTSQASM